MFCSWVIYSLLCVCGPQIPGKLLFSLVKRYLCVTSLMDKLNTAGSESSIEPSSSSPSSVASDQTRLQREFEFTMAMANLISELVRVMGWDRNRQLPMCLPSQTGSGASDDASEDEGCPRRMLRSIFQPRFTASASLTAATAAAMATASGATPPVAPVSAAPTKKKVANDFKTRVDFSTRSSYVEYVQDNLKSGMMVRMLEDYEEVSSGDEGEFRYSNDGSPPVQVHSAGSYAPPHQAHPAAGHSHPHTHTRAP